MRFRELTADVVIVGAGIAGLRAALAASGRGASVLLVSKGAAASPAVIGFNAPVACGDSAELFFRDTCVGGGGLNDRELARLLTGQAVEVLREFEGLGFSFDREDAAYDLLQPLGCSCPRLVHQSNHTGSASMALMREELSRRQVKEYAGVTALDLLLTRQRVCGLLAAAPLQDELWVISAGAVVLANGGGSGIYADSTYPDGIVGDGYGMAYRAGASLLDMEFVQFEPCRCLWPRKLGISTTLLAKGGELRNRLDERFILKRYPGGEGTVSKDMLARLIALEIKAGNGSEHGGVYLDLRMLPEKVLKRDHSMYYERFLRAGIDLTTERIEVAPAAHTFMGGVKIDAGCACGVPGLFAAGEVTGGIHGANRLGGNAGTEIYVFGKIAGASAAEYVQRNGQASIPDQERRMIAERFGHLQDGDASAVIQNAKALIRNTMGMYAGAVRSADGLAQAGRIIQELATEFKNYQAVSVRELTQLSELQNMILTAELVVAAAERRRESRGVHYREDFPTRDDRHWCKSIIITPGAAGHEMTAVARDGENSAEGSRAATTCQRGS
ncbi:MAG: FAD-binding protein [Lentisphaerae bacterium]|nr:FAD-binding protein [Lentisphaerota bacterium]